MGTKPTVGARILTVIACLIMIAAGIFLFFVPTVVVEVFSAAVLVFGIYLIIRYILEKEFRNGWDIVSGIIYILFGGFMLFGRIETRVVGIWTIEFFISVWVIFAGVSRFMDSFSHKKDGGKGWIWSLICGILLVIFGIIFLATPYISSLAFIFVAGYFAAAAFIVIGITGIAGALTGGPPPMPPPGEIFGNDNEPPRPA